LFRIVAMTNEHYEKAGELIERHGASHGLRTLDSLQPAVALNLHRSKPSMISEPPTECFAGSPRSRESELPIRSPRNHRRPP
jgi:hypothetical protein